MGYGGGGILWEGSESMSPLLRWSLRGTSIMVEVALRILSAPVTSAAIERAFSWIHSEKRNRLTSERTAKLMYVSYNWKLLHFNEETEGKKQKLNLMNKNNTIQENKEQENEQSYTSEEDSIGTKKLCDSSEI
ncbi:hypothetical protein AVEN_216109-1 [Araneus ventricosus]|uniref:HAT C-terminal dimerisation domain-containing protein n=1 Tax=Araneus ventricosus TaxID=182803 RepID=A0A4Y2M1X7_ARAVE|nr:hypothetical protein AVEN_216109-1 [Araneus ventricosus]